ncbi:acylneuraminate cytidylyltransferase family protein [Aeromonas veronii]|uniref:acylneuraminate cytidylyltransferase family protein n=1 Tax=Aeromonas veronii TaxID=654 RepID=UPI000F8E83B3|nr:acylneuraminate cytidylyltransferase family protein [Aeromonas veronii]RUR59213.1 acylneuraminate cytidylyltransferase family protein [Aeromonas veronii]
MKNTYTAIITARGGSKGLPRKNVLDLAGKPMIAHTITAAQDSGCFEDVVVTTDCPEIKAVSQNWNAVVINRPPELATDNASSVDVLHHAISVLKNKGKITSHVVLLQPTSPLRNLNHIKEAIAKFESSDAESLVSVTEVNHPIQKFFFDNDGVLAPVFSWDVLTMPRQSLKPALWVNGAIYIVSCEKFIKSKNLFALPVASYLMIPTFSLDIDSAEDFEHAKNILLRNEPM